MAGVARQSLRRLWVAVISRHSAWQAAQSAASEAVDAAVVLGLAEDRLDRGLAAAVERAAVLAGQSWRIWS